MNRTIVRRALLAATALSGIAATPVLAQGAGAAEGGDIIVTARRTEERLQDVPISITVYNQEQISNRNIVNAGDLGIYTPSLTTNSKFGLEKASFVIRGFVQDSPTQPSVGTYFAEVVGPRAAGSTPSGNGVGVGNFFDLQNVQVLKGPQGTLFGRNTTGGAVLLVPKKPTDRLEGYVEGSLGNFDMRRAQGVINVPLADTFKVRLGVDRMTRDGYLINRSGVGPDRLANTDFIAARLSIVAELTPELENYMIGSYLLSDNSGSVPRIVACNPNGSAFLVPICKAQLARAATRGWWDVENNEPNARIRQETIQFINTTTWAASDNLTIKNIVSYAEFRDISRYSLQGDFFANPATGALALTAIRTNNTPGFYLASQSTFTEELQFQGNALEDGLAWQAGIYVENSDPLGFTSQMSPLATNCQTAYDQLKAGQLARDSIQCPGGSISIPFQKTFFRNRGIYAQGTYNFTEQFALTAGIRYTWDKMTHRYDGTSVSFPTPTTRRYTCSNGVRVLNPDGTSPVVIDSLADHARCKVEFVAKSERPTWLLNLEYKPNADMMFYAKWARGFRAGGVAAANITFETWEPEKVDTYEAGLKASFRGAVSGYFNVAGFYNDFTNQQIQAALIRTDRPGNPAVGAAAIVNAGKSRIYGAEVDASATFFDSLKIDLGYTYLNTRVKSIVAPVIPPETLPFYSAVVPNTAQGDRLALSPKHRLTATATYTLPLDESIGAVSFGATWVHTSSQFMTRAVPVPLRSIPATDLLLLNASWKDIMGAPVDLAFFMTNVTNEKFPLTTTTSYSSFVLESQLPNEPRMWGVRLRYRFGG